MALIQVQTTFASAEDAQRVASALLAESLAACCQIVPGLISLYVWEDKLREEAEVLLLAKSTDKRWPELRDRIVELHPYDTPEVIATVITHARFEYMTWVKDSVE